MIMTTFLSWQAKGLHSYIMGLPEDWKLYLSDLENRSSDKRDCTANCLNELIAYGYAQRVRLYAERGRFAGYDYTIYESAQAEIRERELPLYLARLSKRNQKAAENKAKRESEKGLTENGNSVNGQTLFRFSFSTSSSVHTPPSSFSSPSSSL